SGFSLAPSLFKKICASMAVIGVGSSDASRMNRDIARLVRRHIGSLSPESVIRLASLPSRLGGATAARGLIEIRPHLCMAASTNLRAMQRPQRRLFAIPLQ